MIVRKAARANRGTTPRLVGPAFPLSSRTNPFRVTRRGPMTLVQGAEQIRPASPVR